MEQEGIFPISRILKSDIGIHDEMNDIQSSAEGGICYALKYFGESYDDLWIDLYHRYYPYL
ncbi:hypothetical protein D3C78_1012170 [compost metagenome]